MSGNFFHWGAIVLSICFAVNLPCQAQTSQELPGDSSSDMAPSSEPRTQKKPKIKSQNKTTAGANDVTSEQQPSTDAGAAAPEASTKKKKKLKTKVKAKNPADNPAISVDEEASALDSDRVSKRKQKKWIVAASGGYVYFGGGGGIEVSYSPTSQIDLSFRGLASSAKMTAKSSNEFAALETAKVTAAQSAFNVRYFLRNSFFILGGLGYNTYSGGYGFTVGTTKQEFLLPMKASALAINLALGNLWKFDSGFTLGFDWVGYSGLLGLKVKLEDPETAEEIEAFSGYKTIPGGGDPTENAKKFIAKSSTYALLMSLGYSF